MGSHNKSITAADLTEGLWWDKIIILKIGGKKQTKCISPHASWCHGETHHRWHLKFHRKNMVRPFGGLIIHFFLLPLNIIHAYMLTFSQLHTSVNKFRHSREVFFGKAISARCCSLPFQCVYMWYCVFVAGINILWRFCIILEWPTSSTV